MQAQALRLQLGNHVKASKAERNIRFSSAIIMMSLAYSASSRALPCGRSAMGLESLTPASTKMLTTYRPCIRAYPMVLCCTAGLSPSSACRLLLTRSSRWAAMTGCLNQTVAGSPGGPPLTMIPTDPI
jgi:hypothetical protein